MARVSMTVLLSDFRIFIDAPLNFWTRVDTFRHRNHVSSLYRPDLALLSQNDRCSMYDLRDFYGYSIEFSSP